MKNLLNILLVLIISGCAVNNNQILKQEPDKKIEEKVEKELNIEKILKSNNEVKIIIKSKNNKNCSIFLNKRVIELNKIVDKEFIKIIKLKENENIEDIVIKCN